MSGGIEQRPEGLAKLSGTIRNSKVTRASANFVFTDSDKTTLGVVAIAAGIAGLSGQAISTASSANAEESADYVEFDLNGKPVKGWVWRSPFKEGDVVEVAAEWRGDHYEAGGIVRPGDRTIALYPHCSRGRTRHVKNAAKWWLIGTTGMIAFSLSFFVLESSLPIGDLEEKVSFSVPTLLTFASLFVLLTYGFLSPLIFMFYGIKRTVLLVVLILAIGYEQLEPFARMGGAWVSIGLYIFMGIATISMTRQWMVFVRLAEKVFRTLGLPDPSNIDLVKSSKAQRKADDPGEFGTFYFRY